MAEWSPRLQRGECVVTHVGHSQQRIRGQMVEASRRSAQPLGMSGASQEAELGDGAVAQQREGLLRAQLRVGECSEEWLAGGDGSLCVRLDGLIIAEHHTQRLHAVRVGQAALGTLAESGMSSAKPPALGGTYTWHLCGCSSRPNSCA